ncbi:type VII secretion protein EccCb [Actinomadura sp. DC4]|uniref:type VII secretion protein EccCb n=1 Tax=Actinomadura sp. DC4 TaxID=3055069 RepID=UPI0025B157A1|nr:type VII secretion protein EccCb [Actinomadura sp. DC4]MDN3357665.1 type VII secretion protein EccCb [Actinomadura sp. DC4]
MSRDRRRDPFGDGAADVGPATSVMPVRSAPEPTSGRWSRVLFLGEDATRRAFAHAVLARLAAAHPSGRLVIVLRVAPQRRAEWAWTRWLPHTGRTDETFQSRPAFTAGVRPDPDEPLAVVVLDGADLPPGDRLAAAGFRNTVVLDLDGRRRRPGRTTLRLDASPDGVRALWVDQDRTERSTPVADPRAAAALIAPETAEVSDAGRRLAAALDAAGAEHPGGWSPPLTAAPTIDHLLPPLVPSHDRGLTTAAPPEGGSLMVPLGIVDRPFARLPDVLRVDLSGHLLVSGAAGSGRSTLLTTLVIALALTHSPREAQVYCLDPDGSLGALSGLPHVGAVAGDPDTAGATIAKVTALLDHREHLFAEHGVDGMDAYRSRREEFPDERYGDVFLLVEGAVPDAYETDLGRLAAGGPAHGIRLVVTAGPGPEPPAFLRSGTGLELRLDDPAAAPGRGMIGESAFLTALPRVDGVESTDRLPIAVAALVAEIAEHWGERPGAPGVRALPSVVAAGSLPEPDGRLRAVIGVNEGELAPVQHDFATAPHLIVIGDAGSGRTNLLRLVAESITLSHSPLEARILLVDYRGGLLHAMPEEFVLGHAFSAGVLGELVEGTALAIGERVAPASGGRAARDWQGPRLFILIDDYEQVRDRGRGLLEPLVEYLPLGHELGAHLIVACSSAGAGAAMDDPLLRGMHDAGAGTLLLSCPPEEGDVLDGLEPRDLPPGRARYRVRGETILVQTGLAE